MSDGSDNRLFLSLGPDSVVPHFTGNDSWFLVFLPCDFRSGLPSSDLCREHSLRLKAECPGYSGSDACVCQGSAPLSHPPLTGHHSVHSEPPPPAGPDTDGPPRPQTQTQAWSCPVADGLGAWSAAGWVLPVVPAGELVSLHVCDGPAHSEPSPGRAPRAALSPGPSAAPGAPLSP